MHFSDLFQLSDSPIIQVNQLENRTILIIDNIFSYPEKIVELAKQLDYNIGTPMGVFRNYPGERATISVSQQYLINKIQEVLFQKEELDESFVFSDCPTIFTRINHSVLMNADNRQIVPHLDTDTLWTSVIHLNQDESRTVFYRHINTGLIYLPHHPTRQISNIMKPMGFDPTSTESYRKFIKSILMTDAEEAEQFRGWTGFSSSTTNWQIVNEIPAKWNRLICFPARFFHSPVYRVPTSEGYSRLTLNMFMRYI